MIDIKVMLLKPEIAKDWQQAARSYRRMPPACPIRGTDRGRKACAVAAAAAQEMPPQEEREGELYYGLSFPLPSYV